MEVKFDRSSNILIGEKNSVYNVHSCCTFRLAILYLTDRSLDYFAHKIWLWIIHTTSYFVRNRTYVHDFLRVQFFSTKFLHTRLSVGGASLLENWILEGDEQGNIPVNSFVFLSILFGLILFGAKLWMNYRVNMLLSIQKVFPRKKNNPHKLNLQEFKVWSKFWVIMKF